jgi:hypothetical protein
LEILFILEINALSSDTVSSSLDLRLKNITGEKCPNGAVRQIWGSNFIPICPKNVKIYSWGKPAGDLGGTTKFPVYRCSRVSSRCKRKKEQNFL